MNIGITHCCVLFIIGQGNNYEAAQPDKAAVYSWWGYWFKWSEILFSLILLIGIFQIAVAITKNPTPESLIEQLESKPTLKRKYND
jgi:hypothetical protein